jgi:predicted PurR-regulated permease PerM
MGIVGGITTGGLWLLGVSLAPALELLAALAEFVPNVGPFLAFLPALLLALTESATRALAVLLLYLGVQGFESYMLTPLVEKRAVALPPALTITAQVLMAVLAGGLGLALATPLAAAALVLVQRLYVEDTLGDALEGPPVRAWAREVSRRHSLARSVHRVMVPVACREGGWTCLKPSACRPRDGADLSPRGSGC